MLLDEKNRFLEGNIEVLERELKERKKMLEEILASRSSIEKDKHFRLEKGK